MLQHLIARPGPGMTFDVNGMHLWSPSRPQDRRAEVRAILHEGVNPIQLSFMHDCMHILGRTRYNLSAML